MLTRRNLIVVGVVLVIVVGITGAVVWQQFYKPEEAIAGPITVVDDLGRNVTITRYPPERIVSLAPSCTDILLPLELGSKVVGVDEYSTYFPEVQEGVEAGNLKVVGSYSKISIETVVGLEPDLILATGRVQRVVVEELEGIDQPVVALYPKDLEGVLADVLLVGEATGQTDGAEALVTNIKKRIQEVTDKTQNLPRPRVYIEYFFDGGYWSYGAESFINELIYKAGGINVFAGYAGSYLSTSAEEVIKADPEIIIISKGTMAISCGLTPEIIRKRPGWNEIYAVQNDQIYEIDEELIAWPSPIIVDGLEAFAEIIHPEEFR